MAGSGTWSQQTRRVNCGRASCQQGCAGDTAVKPHGPYTHLRRRNPESGRQENVYLGKVILNEEEMAVVNEELAGPEKPTRDMVEETLGLNRKPASV